MSPAPARGRPRLLITAGEASSDAHGAGLVRALRRQGFAGQIQGIGGPALAAEGIELLGRAEQLAVIGLLEAVTVLPTALRLLGRLKRGLREDPPDLFVPIDSPDFNLRLLPHAARAGVPVIYFIAPQLWAWRAGRVACLRRHVRELLVLFPFEEEWFRSRGVPATYVGHPLVDVALAAQPAPSGRRSRPAGNARACGLLLPGSRPGEIARHLPILAEAAAIVGRRRGIDWRLRMAGSLDRSSYEPWAGKAGIELSREPLFELAVAADVSVCVSGTASFEVALAGTPMVVVYRMNRMSWLLARRLVKVPFAAMANVIAGRRIVPELLQDDCRSEKIAGEVERLLDDSKEWARMNRDLLALREPFGAPGAYDRAARRILAQLGS